MIKPSTKLIMSNNPTNPTGFVLSRERLEGDNRASTTLRHSCHVRRSI